jgi:1-acyl-sn-glycerol-3-phosphate acyltransferase
MSEHACHEAVRFPRRALFRIGFKVAVILPWTLLLFGVRMCVLPVVVLSPRMDRRLRRAIAMVWAAGFDRVLGIRVMIRGTPPQPPYLMVSNHLTTVDSTLYVHQLGCIMIGMVEISQWPLIGFMVKVMGNIFIDRSQLFDPIRVNELITRAYNAGEGIVYYPEATTSPGETVPPFKPALLESAVQAGWPVYYATVHHATPEGYPPASWAVCWVGDTPLLTHVRRLLSLPWIETTITFGDAPIQGDDRKALAVDLQKAVRANFTPMA